MGFLTGKTAIITGAGLFGSYGQCSYVAAKEGIRGISRVAANEWGKDNINVNVICPLAWTAQLEKFATEYPNPSREMYIYHLWDIMETLRRKLVVCVFSWLTLTSNT